jgi:hypothetical protein
VCERHPEIRDVAHLHAAERRRRYPDNRERLPVQRDRLAVDRGSAKVVAPQTIRDDSGGGSARSIVVRAKTASMHHIDAKAPEEIPGDELSFHHGRDGRRAERRLHARIRHDVGRDCRGSAQRYVVGM